MMKKDILTCGLLGGLLAGFVGIVVVNSGAITPDLVHIGSLGWFAILGVAFVTGYLDTCVGGGHGTMLTPTLILLGFPSKMVVPAILLSEIGIGILAAILHRRAGNIRLARGEQHRRVLLVLSACSLVGSIIAVTAAVKLPQRWVNLYIGLMIVAVGLLLATGWRSRRGFSMRRIIVLGTVAAFNKGISGGGYGPLLTGGQVLSGINEKGAVSITPLARGLTGLIAVTLYFAAKGALEPALALPLVIGSLLAIPVAVFTVTSVNAGVLRKGIVATILILGVLLVVRALR
ncbi:MAG: sulfite exporter TauE/SafE family protein [Sedimentisphaerales bacterium]|nr:sulfite exporter TauE/SafE family protein [Sedimentisphaerales bacterium]